MVLVHFIDQCLTHELPLSTDPKKCKDRKRMTPVFRRMDVLKDQNLSISYASGYDILTSKFPFQNLPILQYKQRNKQNNRPMLGQQQNAKFNRILAFVASKAEEVKLSSECWSLTTEELLY